MPLDHIPKVCSAVLSKSQILEDAEAQGDVWQQKKETCDLERSTASIEEVRQNCQKIHDPHLVEGRHDLGQS